MEQKINRRDFLKLAGLLPLGLAAPRFLQTSPGKKNILVIVFDALSAYNLPAYGYSRQTTPNLSRLAERAIVYDHRHGVFINGNKPVDASRASTKQSGRGSGRGA